MSAVWEPQPTLFNEALALDWAKFVRENRNLARDLFFLIERCYTFAAYEPLRYTPRAEILMQHVVFQTFLEQMSLAETSISPALLHTYWLELRRELSHL